MFRVVNLSRADGKRYFLICGMQYEREKLSQ